MAITRLDGARWKVVPAGTALAPPSPKAPRSAPRPHPNALRAAIRPPSTPNCPGSWPLRSINWLEPPSSRLDEMSALELKRIRVGGGQRALRWKWKQGRWLAHETQAAEVASSPLHCSPTTAWRWRRLESTRPNGCRMHKPTPKVRRWHQIRARNEFKRRHGSPANPPVRRRPPTRGIANPPAYIRCPANLSLEENFDEVAKLLREIRSHGARDRNERIYIDFRPIENLTPSSALVLAAELDRWNHLHSGQHKLEPVDLAQWHGPVRGLLRDMGFFELLNAPGWGGDDGGDRSSARYVKLRRGGTVDGKAVEDLRELDLDPHISVPNRRLLFGAVTEAMANVKHHAYPEERGAIGPQFWWMSAAYDTRTGEVAILIYDQGEGIPATLPRRFGEWLRQTLPPEWTKDHARLIEAAHELSRTETRQQNRGLGLEQNIRRYIERLECGGIYRVISGKGEYTVRAGQD